MGTSLVSATTSTDVADPSCVTCAFAEPIAAGDDGLPRTECRRYPPQVVVLRKPTILRSKPDGYDAPVMVWPQVDSDDWCGEWRELLDEG